MINYHYTKDDIIDSFNQLNIKKNDTLYITGNLANFGNIQIKHLKDLTGIFFDIIKKKIGPGGTIVVPTHSFYLVKTKATFDPLKTFSETGSFSNYILGLKNSIRQKHPYSSSTAIGLKSNFICKNNTQHVYGPDSPFKKMINLNTKFISLGMPVNKNCSQVHQAEYDMNVPYRYTKEFDHRIKINNKVYKKKFYLFVLYKGYLNLKHRDNNKKFLKNFQKKNKIKEARLGKNYIYCYSLKDFYNSNIELLKKDIFSWMKIRPKITKSFTK